MTDTQRLELLRLLRTAVDGIRDEYRAREQRAGLGAPAWRLLAELRRSGGATPSQIAERLGLHRSTVSNLLRELTASGAVARVRDPHDQRSVAVTITESGSTALGDAGDHVGPLERLVMRLRDDEVQSALPVLARLVSTNAPSVRE